MTSQMKDLGLTEHDIEDLAFDLRIVSIFFHEPLKVRIDDIEHSIGSGLGGLHWSMFVRGTDCTMCGNCCQNTKRRIWFWFDNEPRPPVGPVPLEIFLNNRPITLWLHINKQGDKRCDHLYPSELNGMPVELCDLHVIGQKPIHCTLTPYGGVYKVTNAKIPMLSRRLPPRNWRWPKCPIDVNNLKLSSEQVAIDRKILSTYSAALHTVPNCYLPQTLATWEVEAQKSLVTPRTESLLLYDQPWAPAPGRQLSLFQEAQ